MSDSNIPESTMPDETPQKIGRRGFIEYVAGALGATVYGAAIGYPLYRYLTTPANRADQMGAVTEVTLQDAQALPSGTAMMFRFGSKPGILIHHKDGTWVAFNAVCTHLGCTVQFEPQNDRIYCACHGGVYNDRTGENVAGPPPKPLTVYKVSIGADNIVISRS